MLCAQQPHCDSHINPPDRFFLLPSFSIDSQRWQVGSFIRKTRKIWVLLPLPNQSFPKTNSSLSLEEKPIRDDRANPSQESSDYCGDIVNYFAYWAFFLFLLFCLRFFRYAVAVLIRLRGLLFYLFKKFFVFLQFCF
jgi:hypothetical protein